MKKDKIQFELVQDSGLQKFYKSSEVLTAGLIRLSGETFTYEQSEMQHRLKPKHKHLVREDGFVIVCISNAHTHKEKLAFCATQKEDGECFRLEGQIEGRHTFLIDGGDAEQCWPDETYLRLIARHNGYSQNNVTIKP